MTYNLPYRSTRTTFSGITVQGSATIGGNAYVSGSLNAVNIGSFPIGQGLDLQHGTISSTVTSSGSLYAGPGINIVNSTIINTGTLVPGSGMVISNGTISSTIPGASTLVGGSGIAIGGSTITNTATLLPGNGIGIASGSIYANYSVFHGVMTQATLSVSITPVGYVSVYLGSDTYQVVKFHLSVWLPGTTTVSATLITVDGTDNVGNALNALQLNSLDTSWSPSSGGNSATVTYGEWMIFGQGSSAYGQFSLNISVYPILSGTSLNTTYNITGWVS